MTACNPADVCGVCGRCTMCRPCDPLYDHGGPLPAGNVTVNIHGPVWYSIANAEEVLRQLGADMERAEQLMAQAVEVVDCYIADFLHTPDEHTATHYPDGVLHTFTGPNNDGHTRTWKVATRHPEGTTNGEL